MDPSGEVYTNLVTSIQGLSGTLRNLEKTSAGLPAQLPRVAVILGQLQEALQNVEDVLIALANNPLLKNGIPGRAKNQSIGTGARDMAF
jgi:phospholipid/cholesterol/gamma-HCH transport system substrate-binding protein